jgi:hypothetical protein
MIRTAKKVDGEEVKTKTIDTKNVRTKDIQTKCMKTKKMNTKNANPKNTVLEKRTHQKHILRKVNAHVRNLAKLTSYRVIFYRSQN